MKDVKAEDILDFVEALGEGYTKSTKEELSMTLTLDVLLSHGI